MKRRYFVVVQVDLNLVGDICVTQRRVHLPRTAVHIRPLTMRRYRSFLFLTFFFRNILSRIQQSA